MWGKWASLMQAFVPEGQWATNRSAGPLTKRVGTAGVVGAPCSSRLRASLPGRARSPKGGPVSGFIDEDVPLSFAVAAPVPLAVPVAAPPMMIAAPPASPNSHGGAAAHAVYSTIPAQLPDPLPKRHVRRRAKAVLERVAIPRNGPATARRASAPLAGSSAPAIGTSFPNGSEPSSAGPSAPCSWDRLSDFHETPLSLTVSATTAWPPRLSI